MSAHPKLTTELLAKLDKIADDGLTIKEVCSHIGISPRTWRNWEANTNSTELLDSFRPLAARVRAGMGTATDDLAWGVLREVADNTEARDSDRINAALAILRLRTAHRIEVTGRNGGHIQIGPAIDLNQLTADEIEILMRLTEKAQSKELPRGMD